MAHPAARLIRVSIAITADIAAVFFVMVALLSLYVLIAACCLNIVKLLMLYYTLTKQIKQR